VVSQVAPHLPPLERPLVSEVAGITEKSGDELAASEITAVETVPLLGVSGYIALFMSTLFYAYPKTGKTTLLVQLLKEWAALGYQILVFTEEPEIAWQLRLSGMTGWANVRFVFAMNADPAKLLERARVGREQIVVVDTMRPVCGIKDENDNSEVSRKLAPWLAGCREDGKTPIFFHHGNKAGGDHGRGISGAHSLFASFDAAYEIQRVTGSDNRRLIRGYARMFTPDDLMYERLDDGTLKSLGDPAAVQREEVERRVIDQLGDDWTTRKALIEELEEPRPSQEIMRQVLEKLTREGHAERDPKEDRRGATYRWRRTSLTRPPSKGGRSGSVDEVNGVNTPTSERSE
jgi:hypothetical protein